MAVLLLNCAIIPTAYVSFKRDIKKEIRRPERNKKEPVNDGDCRLLQKSKLRNKFNISYKICTQEHANQ